MQSTTPVELEYPRRMPSNLADRIRRLRELRGVDLRTFATRAGLSQSVISNFLTRASRNPATSMNADNLAAIASAWGADPAWLLTGTGDAPTKAWTEPEAGPQESEPRGAAPVLAPRATGAPIQAALALAFDGRRHAVADLRNVDDVFSRARLALETVDADLVGASRKWLDAAARLRVRDVPFSVEALLIEMGAPSEAAASQLAALDALAPRTDK